MKATISGATRRTTDLDSLEASLLQHRDRLERLERRVKRLRRQQRKRKARR